MRYLEKLNPQQRQAVEAAEGPVMIIAGPGTGKTKTLITRIIHLIESNQARPRDILALTFTKKSAQEMTERVGQKGVSSTFHALCRDLLATETPFISEADRLKVIKSLPRAGAFKGMPLREVGLHISRAKNLAEHSDELARLVNAYDAALLERGVIDFDDLLVQAKEFLMREPAKRPAFTHVLVDEFQDTNMLQYDLLRLLLRNENIFVIGDPNQSIYGFRGASGDVFERLRMDFPQTLAITLTRNYRSAPEIVRLSNAIFVNAPMLRAELKIKGSVQATQLLNEHSEAHWIIEQIQSVLGGTDMLKAAHTDAKRSLKDIAILYRSRRAVKTIQKYIADSGLPFQVVGEGSPYERPDVQEVIRMLRTCRELAINHTIPPADLARKLADQAALTSREVSQFSATLVRFATLGAALDHLEAIADQHFYDPAAEVITLLTIHASKGLEFAHVFLLGLEEGTLPSTKADVGEEKRLFYVAVTRAKEQLDITYVTRRSGESAKVSRFITEVPSVVLPRSQDSNLANDVRRLQKRQVKRAQTTLF